MKWNKTEEILPIDSQEEDPMSRGWVLGRFTRSSICTMRYVESYSAWQLWDYSWSKHAPREWMEIPNELTSHWDELYHINKE